ncbi:hypothetical protein GCM10027033_03450 [Leucobacter ruminantium]
MSAFFRRRSQRENVKLNVEDTNPVVPESAPEVAEKPVRKRAPRRATAAAGAPEPVAESAPVESAAPAEASAPAADAGSVDAAPAEAPKKRVSRSRKKADAAEAPADAPAVEPAAEEAPTAEAPKKRVSRSRKKAEAAEAPADAPAVEPAAEEAQAAETAPAGRGRRRASAPAGAADAASEPASEQAPAEQSESDEQGEKPAQEKTEGAEKSDGERTDGEKGGRGRGRRNRSQKSDNGETVEGGEAQDGAKNQGDDRSEKGDRSEKNGNGQSDRGGKNGDKNAEGPRSSRTRQRDRKRRGQNDDLEPEITEDDVLLPIAGVLDVLDNYAFVRTSGYLPGMSDVYVSLGQVKKYGLRRGDAVVGAIRQPREGEGSRQKYNAIVKVDSINGRTVDENEKRADIAELTPVLPQERLRLAQGEGSRFGAAVDAIAPMGLGQRAIIAIPAKIPAAGLLAELAEGVAASKPDAHLMLVLTNARPEEATQLQRTVRGEVVAAAFDRPAEDQATVAELSIDRARRLVELGHDVVVLLDSLSDLAQAYVQAQQGGRTAPEAAQAQAIAQVKRLLASARNIENGGSLTLVATARTKSGVAFDKELLREITPAANSFVKVSGGRFTPEVETEDSYTLGAEAMLSAAELAELSKLRAE